MKQLKKRVIMPRARDVMDALRLKFPSGAYAFMDQVRNATGFDRSPRTADAVVMSLWPSRGLDLIGIEVKVSRSDWMRELQQGAKADEICKFCDRWYVAVGNEGIVQPGELPPTWGLMVPASAATLKCKVEAPKLTPQPLDRAFVAAVMRRFAESGTAAAKFQAEYARGYREGQAAAKEHAETTAGYRKEEFDALQKEVSAFEESSGIKIGGWQWREHSNGALGEAVRVVLNGSYMQERKRLEKLLDEMRGIVATVEGGLEKLR